MDGTRGGHYLSAQKLVNVIEDEWGAIESDRFAVLTGGEPLLQADDELLGTLHARGFAIAVETNGTIEPPAGLDWICVSPKAGTELRIRSGHELKLVFPQPEVLPESFADLAFERFSLQPMDGPSLTDNTQSHTV